MKSKQVQEFKETEIGKIPADWEVTELENVADVIDPHPSHRAPQIVENGFPFAGIGDIAEDGTIDVLSSRKIGEEFVKQQEKSYTIDEFSIGYGRVGTVGKIVQLRTQTFRYALSPTLAVINPKNSIDKKFLNSVLYSRQFSNQVFARITGTTRPTLGIQQLRKLLIMIPPIDEQKSIGKSLSDLTRKIQNLQNQNRILEQTVQAIFQSWFVDFDGVNEFEDSELGKIPKGWITQKLGNVLIEIETGMRPKGGVSEIKSGIPSIGAESIRSMGIFDFKKIKFVDEEFFNKMKRGIIKNRDVLLYKDGGKPGTFIPYVSFFGDGFPFETCVINEHVYRLRINDKLSQIFLYFWLSSGKIIHEMETRATGAAQPGLNSTQVKSLPILIPKNYLIRKFDNISQPLISSLFSNCKKIQSLTKTRDTLLPKLMSGEIRV